MNNTDPANYIDDNGFMHFLAYTDAYSTSVASIYTDYISLDVTAKILPTNPNMPSTELFDINKVTLHANATRNNGVITLNATVNYQASYIDIPVLPNNQYELKGILAGGGTVPTIVLQYYYNNYAGGYSNAVRSNLPSILATIPNNCNKVRLYITNNNTIGTFTFKDISLKLKM